MRDGPVPDCGLRIMDRLHSLVVSELKLGTRLCRDWAAPAQPGGHAVNAPAEQVVSRWHR
ncbi:hypothetical protein [Lentzea guizhouensis]|uniref:hypothetical protein n=1 Tax=Lentzea guizhouensis TaxID=1586287 RepID=UPI0012B69167|nr:hypothetical protein [Lentzea guizhouensis]